MDNSIHHICFRDVAWLQAFPLVRETVLDYLALSPFWDPTCNNEQLKMQNRHGAVVDMTAEQFSQKLEQMNFGVEYVVDGHTTDHRLFVIHKRKRIRPGPHATSTALQAVIYVLDGNAYLAPRLCQVLRCRLTEAERLIDESLTCGRSFLDVNITDGKFAFKQSKTDFYHPNEAAEFSQLTQLNASFMSKII